MPGTIDAIAAFLEIVQQSGVAKKINDAIDKQREEALKLKANVDGMKDAPPPKPPPGG